MRSFVVEPFSGVSQLIHGPACRVPEGLTIGEVARLMGEANVSAVLVGPDGLIATERDLTRALGAGYGPDSPIEGLTSPGLWVLESTSVVDAAAIMLNEEVRHLIVQRASGELAVISLRVVMAVLLQAVTPRTWLRRLQVSVTLPPATPAGADPGPIRFGG